MWEIVLLALGSHYLLVLWMQDRNKGHCGIHKESCGLGEKRLYKKGGSVMGKATKIWLVIATCLVVAGLILYAAVMWRYKWDFLKLGTGKYETNTHEIREKI